MTIVYRTSGPWGSGQPADLTPAQVDNNFYFLDQLINQLSSEISGGAVVSIATITATGNIMTITLTSGTVINLTIPVATFRWRGNWAPTTTYAVNDIIVDGNTGNVYLVLFAHVSGASFNPGANDGLGHYYYQLMLANQTPVLWPVVYSHTSYFFELQLANAGGYFRCKGASPGTLVAVPPNAQIAFSIDTEIHFHQVGGPIVFEQLSGFSVKINVPQGFLPQTDRVGATVTLKKVDVDEWDLFGLLQEIGSPL
jgi:hypothetical protein